jgi:hypothetical protein
VALKTAMEIIYKPAILLVFWKVFIFSGNELDRAGSGYGQVAGIYECVNEPWVSIKCREFIDWLRTS